MQQINELASKKEPFLFVLSYDLKKQFIQPLKQLDDDILYKIGNQRNYPKTVLQKDFFFKKNPLSFRNYQKSLKKILEEIRSGNTYLLNLTFKTPIETDLTLKEVFTYAKAKYKLYFKDEFICFSPEKFIEIVNDKISTYPMKGTIEASLPNAKEKILTNEKEMAEHVMIVDLMRNDLAMVGTDVQVEKFRYVEKIQAGEKELLQVSSKITAKLPKKWSNNLENLLFTLLPAGSITGAPKRSTVNIINNVEDYHRDFYTGVFGLFDGKNLYSAVMIRFIEKKDEKLYYKSGGGITIDSDARSEYEELIDKIYLPL
ncbi:MAG: Para-aminobenzoate synthase, aminase component (EC [uncultured Sulfurovum sp.]|uniref:Para-aminobenzoate synthase, aminase component (EC) n=1 Tax=uncultured Sulfurovum sp. TaxID=269237 RepID=A0A6S6S2S8_9BACT|nr:MAG: Para-aminobenzoate synthase, aminase component (EC [uncultured Sulfurovum sp.]